MQNNINERILSDPHAPAIPLTKRMEIRYAIKKNMFTKKST